MILRRELARSSDAASQQQARLMELRFGLQSGLMIRSQSTYSAERATNSIEITHNGETHTIVVRRSPVARRFTLRIRAASHDAVLTIPARGKLDEAHKFAEKHAAWVGARIGRLPQPVPFQDGSVIPFRGIDHLITHRPGTRGTVWTERLADHGFGLDQAICISGGEAHLQRRLTDFLKRNAKEDLTLAVQRHSAVIGVRPLKVSLRDTSSRWGSCSASGNLSFSWRLILAPSFVLDYLAAHEVAHLRYLNHSSRFWNLTKSLCPHTDRAEAWLTAHGMHLHRYGKPAPIVTDV